VGSVHGRDLVHKDIKPANILVNRATGTVKLTGFGIASRLARERQSPEPPETIAAHSPTWRPNRRTDESLGRFRSDLYSLGITLYQMLTARCRLPRPIPWSGALPYRQKAGTASRAVGESPALLSAIIMKLLAKTVEARYQTAAASSAICDAV